MNKKIDILSYCRSKLLILASLCMALGIFSCSDNDEELNFIHSYDDDYEFHCDEKGGEKEFIVRSNYSKWRLVPANEESAWLDVWPIEGDYDGKFTVTASANKAAYEREARFVLIANGEIQREFVSIQSGSAPYLELDMASSVLRVPYGGSEKVVVKINSNVGWKCQIVQGAEWISVGDATETQQTLIVGTNEGERREGLLRFTMIGTGNEAIYCDARVSQLDKASDPFLARFVTLAELYDITGNSLGEITENVKVEAVVTSDKENKNTPPDVMFVQDETGRAIMIRFSNVEENSFALNTKLTLHLMGMEFVADAYGMPYISGFNTDCILDNENENVINVQPIVLNSFAEITDAHLGSLVTLHDVEYSVPFGTYCNIDESKYTEMSRSDFPHLIQDKNGMAIRSFIEHGKSLNEGVPFKHARLLPQGSGSVTGLIVKQEGEYAIRMRTLNDDQITNDNRLWSRIAAFYWPDRSIMNFANASPVELSPAIGIGVLYLKGPSTLAYNTGYCYWRTNNAVSAHTDPKGDKTGVISTYQALNTSGGGWKTYFTGSNAAAASGWLVKVSTVGANDVALVLASSSSSGGPKEWTVLYSLDQGATFTVADNYDVTPWESANGGKYYSCRPLRIMLPEACTGQQNLLLKLSPRSKKSAGAGTVSASGTNRLGYVAVEKR